jgi:FAD-dependent urate hydroxylase
MTLGKEAPRSKTNEGMGLAALEQRLKEDLAWLNLPPASWAPPLEHEEGVVLEVAVVGAGMNGLVAAAALRFLGISARLFDKAARGAEGPWLTTARMEYLRSPKQVSGPALDLPALSFRAWYEARHGTSAWEAMDKISRLEWAQYLEWYGVVLDLDIRSEHQVKCLHLRSDGLVELIVEHAGLSETVLARRVILALGLAAFGGPQIPAFVADLPRVTDPLTGSEPGTASRVQGRWSHSDDPLDYNLLRGRKVVVVGGSASAMDSAATALEAGAERVDVLVRRADFPRINYAKGAGNPGFEHGYVSLPGEWKLRLAKFLAQVGFPPPRNSVLRVSRHKNARFHFSSAVERISRDGEQFRIQTGSATFDADHLVLATGFRQDWSLHPEFAELEGKIRTWGDLFPDLEENGFPEIATLPYLNENFQFQLKSQENIPGFENLFCFCQPARLSNGFVAGMIPGVSISARKLAQSIAAGFYLEAREKLYERVLRFNDPELTGEEYE